ncbi:hypothetical protein KRX53_06920 [Dermabacteraceae bacterium TAE3-ERU5]|nr:hypothetical protein [Dermabacteraceae bacterium TAE3-ERU5]
MVFTRKKTKALQDKKKQAKKAAEQVESTLDKALANVRPLVEEGAKEVKERATDLYEQYSPTVKDALQKQSGKVQDRVQDIAAKAKPQAQKLREDFETDYLPRAKKTYGATEATVNAAVAAAVDAARKEWDKGAKDIQAAVVTPAKKKGGFGKFLFLLLLGAAGAGAGYLAWKKSQPVEDPWAPPADFARAHYPAADDKSATEVAAAEAADLVESLTEGDDPAESEDAEAGKKNTHKGEKKN